MSASDPRDLWYQFRLASVGAHFDPFNDRRDDDSLVVVDLTAKVGKCGHEFDAPSRETGAHLPRRLLRGGPNPCW